MYKPRSDMTLSSLNNVFRKFSYASYVLKDTVVYRTPEFNCIILLRLLSDPIDDVHSSTLRDTTCNTTTAHAIEKETRVTFVPKTQENDQTSVVVASSGLDTTNNEHTKVVGKLYLYM